MRAKNFLKNQSSSSARVVEGKLVLSFPEAMTPIVWQLDLIEAKSCSFEVVEADAGKYSLISRKQGSKSTESVASFSSRQEAVDALMVTAYALENASGQGSSRTSHPAFDVVQSPVSASYYHPQVHHGSGWGRRLLIGSALAILVILLVTVMNMKPRPPGSIGSGLIDSVSLDNPSSSDAAGVAVSADEFLRQQ